MVTCLNCKALSFWQGCRYREPTGKNTVCHPIKHIHDCIPWHRMYFVYEGCARPLFLPSGKVLLLMAVYRTARAWIFTGRTRCHHTSTSHKYLFSTFLPASAFIYWLFGNFVWLSRNRRHKKEQSEWVSLSMGRTIKEKGFLDGGTFFLVCFYIPRELPSPTLWVVSQNSGPVLIWWNADRRMKEKEKENWAKERKERLNSVLRDIT